MAINRYLYTATSWNIPDVTTFVTRVNIGATGAVGTTVAGFGITIARTGTGTYTATLDNNSSVFQIMEVSGMATVGTYAAGNHILVVPTAVTNSVASFVTVQPQTGAVGDPPSGSQLTVTIVCKVSSVPA